MDPLVIAATQVISRCHRLAQATEEPGFTTRTFLSPPMREVHALVREWMESAGMGVRVDPAGNLRARYKSSQTGATTFYVGSHLDTVPHAGAFDGVLGVMAGLALVELRAGRRWTYNVEVIGFSEEEGVRFGSPFIGSKALVGEVDQNLLALRDRAGVSVREAMEGYGLDPSRIDEAHASDSLGFLEFHIEQGPVLESLDIPIAVVHAIAGQSRLEVTFLGCANHAGTTPMHLRQDALAGASEWICAVEAEARGTAGLVATVGLVRVSPGATNVIAGTATASLDVRHGYDAARQAAKDRLVDVARQIAARRGLGISIEQQLDQPSVMMDNALATVLEHAVAGRALPLHPMISGAGHDAMILAPWIPAALLFLRSPGGISHHPDECVRVEDVAAALGVGLDFLDRLEDQRG